MYRFHVLSPIRAEAAEAHNAPLLGRDTLGIEVTEPELARRCGLGNLDPQHTEGRADLTAIELALEHPLPPPGAILVTIRPDADAFGAMALFALRAGGTEPDRALRERVALVARADRFAHGDWPGPRPLPRDTEQAWAFFVGGEPTTAALMVICEDRTRTAEERVRLLGDWLVTGKLPDWAIGRARERAQGIVRAVVDGEIDAGTAAGGRIAVVESHHPAALRLGYCLAPVVVALNPEFRPVHGEGPYRKFTICQYREGFLDLPGAMRALRAREPGWGGSPTIIGSPQGTSSKLPMEEVVEIVGDHLLFDHPFWNEPQ